MENTQVIILDKKDIKKNNKSYFILKLYVSFSDVVFDVFVSEKIYNDVVLGVIDNDNIINYCHFKVDSNKTFLISIY